MSTKYKFHDLDLLYFVSFAVINWIDLLTRRKYKDMMIASWQYCQQHKGLEIYGWCIMPSHIHMIIGTHGDNLEDIMRDMKKHTSVALKTAIEEHPSESRREWMLWMMKRAGTKNSQTASFQLWQHDNHPIDLYDLKILHQKPDYIHYNPIEAGIVDKAEPHI